MADACHERPAPGGCQSDHPIRLPHFAADYSSRAFAAALSAALCRRVRALGVGGRGLLNPCAWEPWDPEDMSGHRPGARLIRLATAFTGLALYAPVDPTADAEWGATLNETTRTYLGDELVPDPNGGATMAAFIPAPPERGLAVAGADGRRPRGLVQLGLAGQQRRTECGPRRAQLAEPRSGAAFEGPGELVERGGSGAEPDAGAAVELWVADGPVLRSAVWSAASGVRGGDLGIPSTAGCRREDPTGDPYAEPEPPPIVYPAVRPADRGTGAFHPADSPVPQPAHSGWRRSVTWTEGSGGRPSDP
jgi:hypothetical protein